MLAALDCATGEVIGECYKRHRRVEFRKFLDVIGRSVPKNLDVLTILDNYSTHKATMIDDWLLNRPRFRLHPTPTSSSWLDLDQRWFSGFAEKQIRRGSHRSTRSPKEGIIQYVEPHNEDPRPFVWTKTTDEIL